jgi:hypothetical protein
MVKVDEMSSSRGMSAATHARDFESAMGLRRTGHLTSSASSSGKPAVTARKLLTSSSGVLYSRHENVSFLTHDVRFSD